MKPWPDTLPVMSPLPTLARGATVGHTGSHIVRIRTLLNVHVHMTRATSRVRYTSRNQPRGSLCAEAFTAIEADLEAFSPGRAAAHDGHGRLTEGERAF